MFYYTDYPITGNEVGDDVEIEVLSYDRNKYLTVLYRGNTDEVKTGYVYKLTNQGRKSLSVQELYSLPINQGATKPTRLEVSLKLKARRKRKTQYRVWSGNRSFMFDSLQSVLKWIVKQIKTDSTLSLSVLREVRGKGSWSSKAVVDIEGALVYDITDNKQGARCSGFLSKKHYRKLQSALIVN